MKVCNVQPVTVLYVEMVDSGDYRRLGPDNWEKLYGESWESVYSCEEAEAAYQEYLRADIRV
jgi:hypothetical protein